jgi:hypothetical protein
VDLRAHREPAAVELGNTEPEPLAERFSFTDAAPKPDAGR